MANNFTWVPGESLPHIEEHTKRKLEVLKNYLDIYFDTLVRNPAQDRLNITLVDGFSGGGAYSDNGKIQFGSPLIFLNAVEEATARINNGREKPFEINARFIFVDNARNHLTVLKNELKNHGYDKYEDRITILEGEFTHHLPKILEDINKSQRKGRSIFFLDQFGYSAVPMEYIRRIFCNLERAEVVLNFAIDGLLNYLQEASADLDRYQQFGIDRRFIADWNQRKDEHMGRAITQRVLMSHIHGRSGAKFFTPFMLWSRTDKRWMMLAHLSQHQAARDKMLSVHWREKNSFVHCGPGSIFNIGYDERLIESCDSLFEFTDSDNINLINELINELPSELNRIMVGGSLGVETLLNEIGNRTAGKNSDILQVLSELVMARELEVLSANGNPKRIGTRLSIKDTLILPSQKTFSFLKKKLFIN